MRGRLVKCGRGGVVRHFAGFLADKLAAPRDRSLPYLWWRYATQRRLLERVGQLDQAGLAARGSREADPEGRGPGVEPLREGRRALVLDEAVGHDDDRGAGTGGEARAPGCRG